MDGKVEFKFYIISKTLTLKHMESELNKLLNLNNLTKIILSFDNDNLTNYESCKHLFKKIRLVLLILD